MSEVHWEKGGSKSDQIFYCSGSVATNEEYPEDPSSEEAIDGTHSHTVLEHCLKQNIWDATALIGSTMEDHEGQFIIDEDRVDRVQFALDYVARRMEEMNTKTVWSEAFVDAGKRFNIQWWGGPADITLVGDKVIEVADYKDGGAPVSKKTWQVVTYALGVLNYLEEQGVVVDHVITSILQPRVYNEPQQMEYTKDEFLNRAKELAHRMIASDDPEAPRSAGAWCKYCNGAKAGRCKEFNAKAEALIGYLFKDYVEVVEKPVAVTGPETGLAAPPQALEEQGGAGAGSQLHAIPFVMPEIDGSTPMDTLASLLDAKPIITAIIKEAEAEAYKRAKTGKIVPGQKLVHAKTNRKFVNGAQEKLDKIRAVKRDMYMELKLKTPTKLVDSKEFKALPEKVQQRVQALITKPEGAPTLVPESDPRESYTVDTKELFANVPPAKG